jgi:hypothetical protein
MDTKCSLPCSQEPTSQGHVTFCNKLAIYSGELLAPHPTAKMKAFFAILHILLAMMFNYCIANVLLQG